MFNDIIEKKKIAADERKLERENEDRVKDLFSSIAIQYEDDLKEIFKRVEFSREKYRGNTIITLNTSNELIVHRDYGKLQDYLAVTYAGSNPYNSSNKIPINYNWNDSKLTKAFKDGMRMLVASTYRVE